MGVRSFYSGRRVLLTGGTGFLGHLLTEKLLRGCPELGALYLLVRPKQGQQPEERVQEMLDSKFFDRVRREVPGFEKKVIALSGDCSEPGLGLSDADRQTVREGASVVIHSAASINMKESLKRSIKTNFLGTSEMVKVAKEMKNLKAFVYVSTAYTPCENDFIEEKFYDPPVRPEALEAIYKNFDEPTCEVLSPAVRKGKPNNYVAVKAVTEDLVRREMQGLPACVFRPSVISATIAEPVPGWMLSWFSVCGIMVHVYRGAVRTLCLDLSKTQSLIPCDMTANAVIVAAYKAGTSGGREFELPVYNFVTCEDNAVTSGRLYDYNRANFHAYPTLRALAYPSFSITPNVRRFKVIHFFRDLLPAFFRDIPSILTFGEKRNLRRVIFLEYFMDALRYFMLNDWRFENRNVDRLWQELSPEDKAKFPFDMRTVDWKKYMEDFVLGTRKYLLKDPIETLEKAKKHYKRLYLRRILVRLIVGATAAEVIWLYAEVTSILAGDT